MDFLTIAAAALRALQLISYNPALGGGSSVRLDEISELLGIFAQLVERGDEARDELRDFAEVVGRMAEEGRPPTPAEWATLRSRSDAAHDAIQAAAEDARTEEERIADEEAEAARVAAVEELTALESVPEEDRTDEQDVRIAQLREDLTEEE